MSDSDSLPSKRVEEMEASHSVSKRVAPMYPSSFYRFTIRDDEHSENVYTTQLLPEVERILRPSRICKMCNGEGPETGGGEGK